MKKMVAHNFLALVMFITCANAHANEPLPTPVPETAPAAFPTSPHSLTKDASAASSAKKSESSRPAMSDYPRLDWFFLTHALAFYKPEIRSSSGLDHIYAYWHDCGAYQKASKNEFDIIDMVSRYKAESDKYATQVPRRSLLEIQMKFGDYDHSRKGFPIIWKDGVEISLTRGSWSGRNRCNWGGSIKYDDKKIPSEFYVVLAKDAAPSLIPIAPDAARELLQQQQNRRDINVNILVEINEFEPSGNAWGSRAKFTLNPVWIDFMTARGDQLVASMDEKSLTIEREARVAERKLLEAQRAEEEKIHEAKRLADQKQAEQERRTLLHSSAIDRYKQFFEAQLESASPAERTAMLSVPNFSEFSRTSDVMLTSLAREESSEATFIVQAKGSGRKGVDTRWPGRLVMNVPESLDALKSGHWYIVQGTGSAISPKENQIGFQLDVNLIYSCKKEACADFENKGALGEHIHTMAVRYANQQFPE